MLEMAIADFYQAQQGGRVTVRVVGDACYIEGALVGAGFAYSREVIEQAAMATCLDVEYLTD